MLTKEMVRLDLPHILTTLPGPRATAVIQRDTKVLSPSYTRCYPLVASRGEGANGSARAGRVRLESAERRSPHCVPAQHARAGACARQQAA